MQIIQKVVLFTVAAVFVISVLPFVSSTEEHDKTVVSNHPINKQANHKLSPRLTSEIILHGFLLWTSMGFLMPLAILAVRMSNREQCGRRLRILIYIHAILQILSVFLATAGAVMSIKNFENSFNNNHQRIGVALYGFIWLQVAIGFVRPQRGSKRRSVWFFVHWILGTGVSLLGIINIFTGLQAYHRKASRSVRVWTILFIAEISFITFFYLFQDKWDYMQKQGVILGNDATRPCDQEHSQRVDKQEETGLC